jgi:hypothetical protein
MFYLIAVRFIGPSLFWPISVIDEAPSPQGEEDQKNTSSETILELSST